MPQKLLHALEILGPSARRLPGVAATSGGAVGASPAATAAWLGEPDASLTGPMDYLVGRSPRTAARCRAPPRSPCSNGPGC